MWIWNGRCRGLVSSSVLWYCRVQKEASSPTIQKCFSDSLAGLVETWNGRLCRLTWYFFRWPHAGPDMQVAGLRGGILEPLVGLMGILSDGNVADLLAGWHCALNSHYTGWLDKNAPSFLAQHLLLLLHRNLTFCPPIERSIPSWKLKFRINGMRTFDFSIK